MTILTRVISGGIMQRDRIVRNLWWLLIAVGGVGFALTWFLVPQTRQIHNPIHLLVKVVAFIALCFGIATMRPRSVGLAVLVFTGVLAVIVPRLSFLSFSEVENVGTYYTTLYFLLVPGTILLSMTAYRAGGAGSGMTLKLGLYELVIFFSGLLDLTYFLINPIEIPALIDAPHIVLITGRPLSYLGAIVFCAAHLPILYGIRRLPLEKYLAAFD